MSKLLVGIIVGGCLGLLDGLSAYFTPAVRLIYFQIVIGSTLKGLITGVLTGMIASRTQRLLPAIVAGLLFGLALSYLAAALTPDPTGHHYYFQIMLPGAVLGAIVGFSTQKLGSRRPSPTSSSNLKPPTQSK